VPDAGEACEIAVVRHDVGAVLDGQGGEMSVGCEVSRGAGVAQEAAQRRVVTIPIVGVRTDAQLADNLAATGIDLEPAELERLDEISRVPLRFPGDFGGASLAYGNTFDRIDDHRGTVDPLV
jgi:hypothetical protein